MGYVTCGTGKPLILIVGYTGTLFHWNYDFIRQLAKKFTVYMVDNRRIGLSDSNNTEDMAGLADDIADFIVAKDILNPVIFGWSMGGIVTQELAHKYGNKIDTIILMATVPNMRCVSSEFTYLTQNSYLYSDNEYRNQLYYYFFSKKVDVEIKNNRIESATKLENYNYRFNKEAESLQRIVIQNWNGMSKEKYQNIKIPTLIIWAKNDLVVPFEAQKFILDNIANSKLVVYSTGAHFMIHINQIQISQDIVNFVIKEANNV